MNSHRDVVVTGMGIISPIGLTRAEVLDSLLAGRSGIGLWEDAALAKKFAAGRIARSFAEEFPLRERPYLDRCSQMALLAARQAIEEAGIGDFSAYGQRAGAYYGTVRGGLGTEAAWARQFYVDRRESARPYTIMAEMLNAGAAQISIHHQIHGPVITHSAACASSGAAIGDAFRSIRHGLIDVAVAGGAEASLIPVYFGAWDGLRALAAPDPADAARSCKPFSTQRNGLVLAEGSVFFVLESAEHARRRGARAYCRLSGYGIAADAHHIGAPSAKGQAAAMAAAIDDAGLRPSDIGYINAHATATPGGDPIEAAAIRQVFAAVTDDIPVSATKSIHGHMLGAASAMELAVCLLAIGESFLPATANLDEIDPQCRLRHVANRPLRDHRVDHALSLSAGFGGTNVALLVSRPDAPRSRS